jgi:hypothetical protein
MARRIFSLLCPHELAQHGDWYHRGPCHSCAERGSSACLVYNPGAVHERDIPPEAHILASCPGIAGRAESPWALPPQRIGIYAMYANSNQPRQVVGLCALEWGERVRSRSGRGRSGTFETKAPCPMAGRPGSSTPTTTRPSSCVMLPPVANEQLLAERATDAAREHRAA